MENPRTVRFIDRFAFVSSFLGAVGAAFSPLLAIIGVASGITTMALVWWLTHRCPKI